MIQVYLYMYSRILVIVQNNLNCEKLFWEHCSNRTAREHLSCSPTSVKLRCSQARAKTWANNTPGKEPFWVFCEHLECSALSIWKKRKSGWLLFYIRCIFAASLLPLGQIVSWIPKVQVTSALDLTGNHKNKTFTIHQRYAKKGNVENNKHNYRWPVLQPEKCLDLFLRVSQNQGP